MKNTSLCPFFPDGKKKSWTGSNVGLYLAFLSLASWLLETQLAAPARRCCWRNRSPFAVRIVAPWERRPALFIIRGGAKLGDWHFESQNGTHFGSPLGPFLLDLMGEIYIYITAEISTEKICFQTGCQNLSHSNAGRISKSTIACWCACARTNELFSQATGDHWGWWIHSRKITTHCSWAF